jgi:hypothetical protein
MGQVAISMAYCCVCGAWMDEHDVYMFDTLAGDPGLYCRDCAGRHLLVCRECSVRYAESEEGVCSRCAAREHEEEQVHAWYGTAV